MNKYHEEQFNNVKAYIERIERDNKYLHNEILRLNNIINELEKWLNHSIESINEKLDNARDKSGIMYSMNDYQILRLRTFRTKMKEVLDKLKELKENK